MTIRSTAVLVLFIVMYDVHSCPYRTNMNDVHVCPYRTNMNDVHVQKVNQDQSLFNVIASLFPGQNNAYYFMMYCLLGDKEVSMSNHITSRLLNV